jgi:hypothetical protein
MRASRLKESRHSKNAVNVESGDGKPMKSDCVEPACTMRSIYTG